MNIRKSQKISGPYAKDFGNDEELKFSMGHFCPVGRSSVKKVKSSRKTDRQRGPRGGINLNFCLS